ncbi:MAG: glycosyltransferase family 2 protein [Acidobacteria bacterium]|nr:glycosyltransferase family 2 protein [Acidobacteriota bacterium]
MPDLSKLTVPVVLIIFNRPDTTAQVFERIREAAPDQLFVIADGPRSTHPGDAQTCAATRAIINQVDWDCTVHTRFSDVNLGCHLTIVPGLDWVFDHVTEAIIFEDDCLPHPTFFRFCAEVLERHRHEPQIMTVCGNNFQFGRNVTSDSYYFSRYAHTWGWATWRRAWEKYDLRAQKWKELKDTNWLIDLLGDRYAAQFWGNYFQRMTEKPVTWDYAVTFAAWVHNAVNILPNRTLVSNIGFGDQATTTRETNSAYANLPVFEMAFPLQHPDTITRHVQADDFTEQTIFSRNVGKVFEAFKSRKSK